MSNDRPDYRGNPLDFIGTLADVAGGLGDWVANGTPPAGSIPAEIQQRYRDHCDAWSNGPTWVQQFDPGARLFLSNACKPWLDSQGSGDPVNVVPFTGGQCDCARYGVQINVRRQPQNTVQNAGDWATRGPIESIYVASNGQLRGVSKAGWDTDPTNYPACSTLQDRRIGAALWGGQSTVESVTIINSPDGDNCGDPQGEPGPNPNPRPDPGLDPEDEPFVDPDGRPFLPMPPIDDPFGEPVQLPNLPLPRVDGPSLVPEDEPPLAEPGEPGTPETVAGDEEAEGEADEDELLTGVKVEIDSAPSFARQVQNVSTPTYIGAAYVYLGWEDQLDLQPEGQFLVDGQFFAAVPGMTHWRVRSAVGYTLTITPFYAPKE